MTESPYTRLREQLIAIAGALNLVAVQEVEEIKTLLLVWSEELQLSLSYSEARQVIVLKSVLGVPVSGVSESLFVLALGYNAYWQDNGGCALSRDPKSGEFALISHLGVTAYDTDALALFIINFLDKARAFRTLLAKSIQSDTEFLSGSSLDNFIRV